MSRPDVPRPPGALSGKRFLQRSCSLAERFLKSGSGEEPRRVKNGERRVGRGDEQRNFRTAKDDCVTTASLEPVDDGDELPAGLGLKPCLHELIENDRVNSEPFFLVRNSIVNPLRLELCRVDRAFHEVARTQD